ncbi:MAG: hypothetical protein NTZ09_00460, partial [Candidatus Hydrogenedentes bacterium]|nr:hypothetical protein [Candidatus Hydrogenedentota bacterium]
PRDHAVGSSSRSTVASYHKPKVGLPLRHLHHPVARERDPTATAPPQLLPIGPMFVRANSPTPLHGC